MKDLLEEVTAFENKHKPRKDYNTVLVKRERERERERAVASTSGSP